MHPVLYSNTHHDTTDLVNHRMVKNTKTQISWERNITFLRNKKILNLSLRWHILRSYRFVAKVAFNSSSCYLWTFACMEQSRFRYQSSNQYEVVIILCRAQYGKYFTTFSHFAVYFTQTLLRSFCYIRRLSFEFTSRKRKNQNIKTTWLKSHNILCVEASHGFSHPWQVWWR